MEQSYKEKYEQAIEKIKNLIDKDHNDINVDDILNVFPELKESEDERIGKELIKHLKELSDWKEDEVIPVKNPSYYRQWASWLEKQGQVKESTISQHENRTCEENGNSLTYEDERIRAEENKGNIGGISPNSAWSEEDECYMSECIGAIATRDGWSFDEKRKTKHWLKSLKDRVLLQPKQKWSEEDERVFDSVIGDILCADTFIGGKETASYKIDWLQSLKDRVQPQPKQEWSEEDEEILRTILSDGIRGAELDMLQVNWLKSLRPQNRWKPSSEQIGLLQAIINEPNNASSESCQIVLKDILEQLKKLKKEQA